MELKTARLTVLIDPAKKKALETLCARQDVTPSQVVRRLIRDYLAGGNKPPTRKPSTGGTDSVKDCLRRAVHFYSMLQTEDGHWSGDYGGPMFLMPGLVVAWYMMGKSDKMISASEAAAMTHYIAVHQQADGGWGTHSTYCNCSRG